MLFRSAGGNSSSKSGRSTSTGGGTMSAADAQAACLRVRVPWLTQELAGVARPDDEDFVLVRLSLTPNQREKYASEWRPAWQARHVALVRSVFDEQVVPPHMLAEAVGCGCLR
mgnify:CR=1 FL=1